MTASLKGGREERLHDLLVDVEVNKATGEAHDVAVVVLAEKLGKCGRGLFAAALVQRFPWMTVCEEGDFPEVAEKLVIAVPPGQERK